MATRAYNLAAVSVILGSVPVTEWGESDAISIVPESDRTSAKVSADGSVTMSVLNDNRHTATITVMETSYAYTLLSQLAEAQAAAQAIGQLGAFAFLLIDPATGDKVAEPRAVFRRLPDMTKAKEAGQRVFQLHLPSPTITRGASITPI